MGTSSLIVILCIVGGSLSEKCDKIPIKSRSLYGAVYSEATTINVTPKSSPKIVFTLPANKKISTELYLWSKEFDTPILDIVVGVTVTGTKGEVTAELMHTSFCVDFTAGDCSVGDASPTRFPLTSACKAVSFTPDKKSVDIELKKSGDFVDFYVNGVVFARATLPFAGSFCDDYGRRMDIDRVTVASDDKALDVCV